jgi:hypothetical protein
VIFNLDQFGNGPDDDQHDDDITTCGKYRLMILRLLDNGHETNIPQETRDAAYDLLDEYFGDQTIEKEEKQ